MSIWVIALVSGIWVAEFAGPDAARRCEAFIRGIDGADCVWMPRREK